MNPHFIPTNKGKIATYSVGKGQPVIFLHGGPGDTHHYMRRMAEPLTSKFHCIFFDQRGTGQSKILNRNSSDFTLQLLFDDLIAVMNYYKVDTVSLVGHSWGAMYALFASLRFPELFPRAALLNMGPLDKEMERATSQSLLDALSKSEKENWNLLRKLRSEAQEAGRLDDVLAADKQIMQLRVKSWIFKAELRESFLLEYYQDPPTNREVNNWIWQAIQGWFSWDMLPNAKSDFWICVGRNDSVPVEQATKFTRLAPNSNVNVFEDCGHIPWLEYPEKFYGELCSFLNCTTSAKRTVIENYEVAYTNPIRLRIGDKVQITKRETNPDWLGWVFCIDKNGISGWVSKNYLKIEGSSAEVLKNYDASELAVTAGEQVYCLMTEFGWAWVRNNQKLEGWVPVKNLGGINV